jgi:hypothetical protein
MRLRKVASTWWLPMSKRTSCATQAQSTRQRKPVSRSQRQTHSITHWEGRCEPFDYPGGIRCVHISATRHAPFYAVQRVSRLNASNDIFVNLLSRKF